ncbi:response regulator [bacterium]|nr:response regulator [bacterium]
MQNAQAVKVLIADDDGQMAHRLASELDNRGFECEVALNGRKAKELLLDWKPKFFLVDLMLPDGNGLELIQFIKVEPSLRHTPIQTIVTSGHNSASNVHAALRAGARDYLVKPFTWVDAYQRLVFHLRGQKEISGSPKFQKGAALEDDALVLHLTDLVLKQALAKVSLGEILFNLTAMAAIKMDGVRCSIVHVVEASKGVVVASNDNKKACGIELDLNRYPEITQAMNFGKIVALENLATDPHFKNLLNDVRDVQFNSLIVCPIQRQGRPFGVLSVRLPESKTSLVDNEVRFADIVAQTISLILGQGRHLAEGDYWLKNRHQKQVLAFPSPQIKKR